MTGLEKIVQSTSAERCINIWQLCHTGRTDFYGSVEDLYPELAGRINRSIGSLNDLSEHSQRSGTQFVRVSGGYVTGAISKRVTASLQKDPNIRLVAELSNSFIPLDVPILLLGLRCGTRTLVDGVTFYCKLIDLIHAKFGRFAVVIDGLNASPGAPLGESFRVLATSKTVTDPLLAEQEIASMIQAHCSSRGMTAVNCVGTSMKIDLHWIRRACFFVAPWGGGYAKYRWIMNIPGYALTNAHNLREPFILSIYHSEQFMEAGTPLYYPDPAWITDIDNQAPAGAQSDASFIVDDVVIDDIAKHFLHHAITLPKSQ